MDVHVEPVTLQTLQFFLAKHTPTPGRALVVGSRVYEGKPDRRGFYKDAFGVDMLEGPGVDLVHDLERPLPRKVGKFEHVDLVSVLEHVQRPWLLCENVVKAMAPGASILVSVPFVWRVHAYPSDYWRMTPEALDVLFPRIEWETKRFVIGNRIRKKVHGLNHRGETWMARAETVAFGRLTS